MSWIELELSMACSMIGLGCLLIDFEYLRLGLREGEIYYEAKLPRSFEL